MRDRDMREFHGSLMSASTGGLKAVFKGLFSGFSRAVFGVEKTESECPKLYALLKDVARRVDTEPVDDVYIAPGSDLGVKQDGRGPFGMFGSRRRVLILGLATLPYLTISELKAILAHEYAHFSHGDTFYNRFVAQVTLALAHAREGMRQSGGWVSWINPFFWFFWLYSKAYALLSSGFSRSREFLADRMACSLYGSDVFVPALGKAITEGVLFDVTVFENVRLKIQKDKAYVNMYQAFREFREKGITAEERKKLNKKLLDDKPSLFASHPTFGERVAAAKALPRAAQVEKASAMTLFEKPEEIEKELTDFLSEVFNYIRSRR
jgi:Zn-dependent protease with chaperone function